LPGSCHGGSDIQSAISDIERRQPAKSVDRTATLWRLRRQGASILALVGSMTPAALAKKLVATRNRLVHPALMLAACLAALGGAARADAGFQAAPGDTLRIATYNVQFVTPDLPLVSHLLREWPGHKPNVTARAQAIAARLACFDVVALQETINDQRRREIFERLETSGRACGKRSRLPSGRMFAFVDGPDVDGGSWLPLVGNELALASRLPILAASSHVYQHAATEDALAAKGVLHARLAGGPGEVIDVFVTHLQAGNEHPQIRRRQIEELAAVVRAAAHGAADPILVLGDFNVRGTLVDRQDPASDYNFLQRTLRAAVAPRPFVDAWLTTHAADPDAGSGTKPRLRADGTLRAHEERIDYVFLAGADAAPRAMRRDFFASDLIVDGEPVGHLSDHTALLAEISWSRAFKPARIAGSGP
jgi:endonuclease/exonuclease/phosphatase family metal-dependent hydrolase